MLCVTSERLCAVQAWHARLAKLGRISYRAHYDDFQMVPALKRTAEWTLLH